jgi:hypothetical protein
MTNPSKKRGQGLRSTLTAADKRRLYAALEMFTETVSEGFVRYKPDSNGTPWTDDVLATYLGLSEHHVSYVRNEAFGKLYEPEPVAESVALESRIAALESMMAAQTIVIRSLQEQVKGLETRLPGSLPGNDLFGSAA